MALKKKKAKKKAVKRKPAKKRIVKKTSKKITVKKTARKITRKAVAKKKPAAVKVKKTKENLIGNITHYFPHVQAAVIKLKAPLSVGDTIKVKGHTTDFTQEIVSLQIDRVPVNSAKVGAEIGLLVKSRVRQHDLVYKV
jgi:putative protease